VTDTSHWGPTRAETGFKLDAALRRIAELESERDRWYEQCNEVKERADRLAAENEELRALLREVLDSRCIPSRVTWRDRTEFSMLRERIEQALGDVK